MTDRDPQTLAEACRDALWAEDDAAKALGVTIDAVGPGTARASLTITRTMANGHGDCHGGYIFCLSDMAFAYACNSYGPRVVAQHCSVTFLAPAKVGETLTATATETARWGRNGLYDISIHGEDGRLVAEFRGHSRQISGHLLDGKEETR
ncbi:hydroxyphenylacetyl-CoA thioesterase PaaI [Rhodospirillum sp. A1_3_36]|uniref:hydroxyphenylacetyl-CoA thioesterase PaaI n=1 Tax=Rhodospirillum sp. A1_3_36 TaxID=3391666 RepID=UPI0039A714D7